MQINFGLPNILLHKTKQHTLLIPVKNRQDFVCCSLFVCLFVCFHIHAKLHILLIPVKNRHDIKLKEYFVFFARLCTSCSLVAVSKIMAFIAIIQLISFIQVTNVYRMDQSALWVYIIQTIINEYMC